MKIQCTNKEDTYERPLIDEGLYDATLKEVKPAKDGSYGPRVAFIYSIDQKEVSIPFVVNVGYPATKSNNLGKTIIAHGVDLPEGEIDLDSLVGTKAKVMVENYKPEDQDKLASGISKVKPLTEITEEQ